MGVSVRYGVEGWKVPVLQWEGRERCEGNEVETGVCGLGSNGSYRRMTRWSNRRRVTLAPMGVSGRVVASWRVTRANLIRKNVEAVV